MRERPTPSRMMLMMKMRLARRPLVDLALVLAVVGLVMAAYVIAGQPWSLELPRPAPAVQTSLAAPAGGPA